MALSSIPAAYHPIHPGKTFDKVKPGGSTNERVKAALLRKLDRVDPSYRNSQPKTKCPALNRTGIRWKKGSLRRKGPAEQMSKSCR